ncbi:MAG: hypothetical protein K6A42_03045 [Treponema sp.]|nr:hypothetical protein [Treponema sp.]
MYNFVDKLRRFFLFSLVFSFCAAKSFGQAESLVADLDMGKVSYSWLSVLSGPAICRPMKNSYGWMVLTGGKMACAFSQRGKVLWQMPLPAAATSLAALDQDDFAFLVLRNKKLCLLNPSGLALWQKPLDFEAKFKPLPGRDGRVFVFGKDCAACFGMNGVQKWKVKSEGLDPNLSPKELDDGSLLLFLEGLENSKSRAVRLSPFGEIVEKIIFAGKVTEAFSAQNGVMLCFSDGSLGLCSVSGSSEAQSKWVSKDLALGQKVFFKSLSDADKIAIASPGASGTKVQVVNAKNGSLLSSFSSGQMTSLESFEICSQGFFLSNAKQSILHSLDGKKIRGALHPPKTKKLNWDYVMYGGGNIILTSKNWSLVGWRLTRDMPNEKAPAGRRQDYKNFLTGISDDHARSLLASSSGRQEDLKKGLYGSEEKIFLHDANAILSHYFERIMSQNSLGGSIGSINSDELYSYSLSQETAVISSLGFFASGQAASLLARTLNSTKDESVLIPALKSVQECGYDPDGDLIDAVEKLCAAAPKNQEALLQEACKALYSLCRFMGRPVIVKKGLKILSNLQLPQYPKSTKEEARRVYEKLAELKL